MVLYNRVYLRLRGVFFHYYKHTVYSISMVAGMRPVSLKNSTMRRCNLQKNISACSCQKTEAGIQKAGAGKKTVEAFQHMKLSSACNEIL